MGGSMIKPTIIAGIIIIALALPIQAQIKANGEQEVLMSARDGKIVLIPPGSQSFLVPMVASPPTDKQDTFDIASDNSTAIVTLISPNGTEINANNAASLGY